MAERYNRWAYASTGIHPFVPRTTRILPKSVVSAIPRAIVFGTLAVIRCVLFAVLLLLIAITSVVLEPLSFLPYLLRLAVHRPLRLLTDKILAGSALIVLGFFFVRRKESAMARRARRALQPKQKRGTAKSERTRQSDVEAARVVRGLFGCILQITAMPNAALTHRTSSSCNPIARRRCHRVQPRELR